MAARGARTAANGLRVTPEGSSIGAVGEDRTRGHSRPESADTSGESGWITTEVAARAVRVSPRTIRRYIDQGKLRAKQQGEGVNRTWLVSVDSLHALRASRTIEEESPEDVHAEDSIADVFRELAARLEHRAAEAAELRTRLELTERAQSTREEDRRRALEDLTEERRRREEAERERDELRQELEQITPRSRPWWVVGLVVIIVVTTLAVLSLTAIISPP